MCSNNYGGTTWHTMYEWRWFRRFQSGAPFRELSIPADEESGQLSANGSFLSFGSKRRHVTVEAIGLALLHVRAHSRVIRGDTVAKYTIWVLEHGILSEECP